MRVAEQMNIEQMKLADLVPYDNNPRINDDAVKAVAESIRQVGYVAPIIVDENKVILAGHTRLKALLSIGRTECDVIVRKGLSEEQKRKYRLLDNKTGELAEWDFDKLAIELEGLDFNGFDFGFDTVSGEKIAEKYTNKEDIPHYEIEGKSVSLLDLVDVSKANAIMQEIDGSGIGSDEKDFLKIAACRLYVFNYKKIAEFYAQADPEMQMLMERLALVIIDYDNAIANGYAKLRKKLDELRDADNA